MLIGERELGPRDRQAPGSTPDRDDDRIATILAPVGNPDRVRVDKHRRARLIDELDAATAQGVREPLLIVDVIGDTSRARQGSDDVELRSRAVESEPVPRLGIAQQPSGTSQRPHRRWAVVETRASDLLRLKQCDVGAELTCVQRGAHPGRPPAEHDHPHGDTRVPTVGPP